ncbi:hypothetical protein CPC16_007612 [Podila verticillata]|nr:hypothetical protein CPC16_007612 [Podila verticillata]
MNKYDDRLRDEIYERVSLVDKTEVYKRLHNAFVRWYDGKDITTVCRDHYPAVYKTYPKALAVDDLRDYQIKLDQLRGTIAVSVGTTDNSKLLDALSSDADLQVLGISLYGLKDRKDFDTIKDMVYKSSIPSINLSIDVATYMPCFHSKLFRLKKRIDVHLARFDRSRFDPLLELMQHPKLKVIETLSYSYHDLGEDGSKHVAEIVAQNPLVKLKYAMRRDSDLAVLKAIRWECLMGLKITFGGGCPPEATDVLSSIVEANNSVVRLNTFKLSAFDVVTSKDMSAVLSIVSLLSVVKLDITMRLNGDQAAAILESVNFSRLRVLDFGRMDTIWTADETAKVLDILDRRLIILEEIQMYSATLTEEQMDRLRAKGLERIHVSHFS